jgi:hypothetical protein
MQTKAKPGQPSPAPPSWEANAIRWAPSEGTFPMSHLSRPSRWAAVGWTGVGMAATVLPLQAVISEWRILGWQWSGLLLRLPFLMAGAAIFIFGASRFYCRRLYTVRKEEVECDQIGILDRFHWKESIRRYEGTLKQFKYYSGGKAGRARLYYEVILKHADPAKSVVLFHGYSWKPLDEAWRRFAKFFQVPALVETPKGIVRLSTRDLDAKPALADLDAWADPKGLSLSKAVTVNAESGVYELRFRDRMAALPSLLQAGLLGAFAGLVGLVMGPLWGAVVALTTLNACARVLTHLFGWEIVRLSTSGVEHNRLSPWRLHPVSQLPVELLTNCKVGKDRFWRAHAVRLEAEGDAVAFGHNLPMSDRERIRDLAILVLSHGPSRVDLAS